jgi:hypothetical protein
MRLLFVLVVNALMVAVSGCNSPNGQQLPSRSDCIVRIDLAWPKIYSTSGREAIIDNLGKAAGFSAARGGPDIQMQTAFPGQRRDVFYVQFDRDCEHRLEHARDLVAYLKRVVPKAPAMHVSDDVIKPGNDTINAWGPEWRDKGS